MGRMIKRYKAPIAEDMIISPWSQQKGEHEEMFAGFTAYMALGRTREIAKAAETLFPGDLTARRRFLDWSANWDWRRRASLLDRERERIAEIEEREAIRDMKRRHVSMALIGQDAALNALKEYVATATQEGDKLRPTDAIRLLEMSFKMERLSRGLAGEITHYEGTQTINIREQRAVLLRVLDSPDGVEHMAAISKLMGTDGGEIE